jgi:DNA-binding CsgD family transcriptional regulator
VVVSDVRRLGGTRLVGRQREMARVRSCVDAVQAGGAALLEVVGDPGIGKSRLLAETEQVAAQARLTVITGSASQFEREVPFAAFVRLLDRVAASPAAAGPPEQPAPQPGGGAGPDVERFRFYRQVRDWLGTQPHGLALLLDDLHWADAGSLELAQFLLRHPPAVPLLLAVAYRPRQASARAAEAFTADSPDLVRERLDLAPLGVTEIGTLTGIAGAEARRLHAASGGNPFYALALSGSAVPAEPLHPAGTDQIPPAVVAAVRAEMAAVPPPDLAVLQAAAVAGDPFDPSLVADLVERPFPQVLDALDALAGRDLVRAEPSEPGRLRLRHPLLRSIAYHEIPPGQRLTLHARAAGALRDRGEDVVTLAPHLARSAQPGDTGAAQALTAAARQILATAPDTAARWLRKALQLTPDPATTRTAAATPPADAAGPVGAAGPADSVGTARWRLELLLADAEVSSGRVEVGRAVLQQLLDRLPAQAGELRVEAVMRSAFADRLLGRYGQATALLAGTLESTPDGEDTTVLLAVEAVTCSLLRCSSDAHRYVERAARSATAVGRPELTAAASIIAAMNGAFHGDVAGALARLAEAVPVLDGAHDEALFRLMDPLEQLGWAELLLERTADAATHFDRGLDVTRRHGQVQITPYLFIGRCLAFARRGLIDTSLAAADDADEAARLIGSQTMQAMAMAMRATALMWRDGPDEALRVAEAAVRRNERTGSDWWAAVARRILARCQLMVGNPAAARHTLLGSGTDLPLADVEVCAHPMWFAALAEIEAALGEQEASRRWLLRAEQAAGEVGLRGQRAYVQVAAARLAGAAGDGPRALSLAIDAVLGFDQVGQPLDAAVARLTAAGALARAGRWQEATHHLAEARTAAERGGATWFLAQVTGMQRQIASGAGRTEAPAAEARPMELTAREWEIARLAGEGLSNVQIAFRLHVTPKTVEAHLTRIYRKLGVRSRSGLARTVAGLDP